MKIAILDYGMGNKSSLVSAFNFLGINDIFCSSDYKEIKSADKIILPGVGALCKSNGKY